MFHVLIEVPCGTSRPSRSSLLACPLRVYYARSGESMPTMHALLHLCPLLIVTIFMRTFLSLRGGGFLFQPSTWQFASFTMTAPTITMRSLWCHWRTWHKSAQSCADMSFAGDVLSVRCWSFTTDFHDEYHRGRKIKILTKTNPPPLTPNPFRPQPARHRGGRTTVLPYLYFQT